MRTRSRHGACAVLRCRCKVIVGLVQGKSPTKLSKGGLCSESQVYRVAQRFVEQGSAGMADQREDNGDDKITETFEWELLIAVACSPRDYGYLRTTWTQELLGRVLAERTGITVSATTICRLLKRHRVRLGRPKPIVGCPWPKARRMRRLQRIRRRITNLPRGEIAVYVDEVDIHLNPKIGPDWMLCGQQKTVLTPGKNEKRYLAGGAGRPHGPTDMGRGRSQDQRLVHPLTVATAEGISGGQMHSCGAGQLQDPRQSAHAAGFGIGRQSHSAALPAAVLPRSQPHRADVERSPRQRHSQPPLPEHERPHDRGLHLPPLPESIRTTRVSPHKGRLTKRPPKSRGQ